MIRMFFSYWIWHYSEGFKELWILSRNFLNFIAHFFSIQVFFSTLFRPLPPSNYPKVQNSLVVKTFTRFVGFFMKLVVIFAGLIFLLTASLFFALLFVFWAFLPIIFCLLLIGCLKQIL